LAQKAKADKGAERVVVAVTKAHHNCACEIERSDKNLKAREAF